MESMTREAMTREAIRKPPETRILIVDDEVEIAENLRDILALKDYDTLLAHNPESALDMVGREQPDLVMLDINLGGDVDGIETAERIQQRCSVPIVYVTAYCDEELVQRAQETEPMGYLLKPFEAKQVLTTVRIGLSNFERQRETRRNAARFNLVHEHLQDGLLFANPAGKVLFLNHSAETLTGCGCDQATGMELHQLVKLAGAKDETITADLVIKLFEDSEQKQEGAHSQLISHKSGHHLSYRIARTKEHDEVVLVLRKLDESRHHIPSPSAPGAQAAPPPETLDDLKAAAAKGCYAAVFMINHFGHFRQRFGSAALAQVRLAYEQHIAQNIHDVCTVYSWDNRTFVVIIEQQLWSFETERAISHVASAALQYFLQLPTRSALLRLTSGVMILPPGVPNGLPRRIRSTIEKLSRSVS